MPPAQSLRIAGNSNTVATPPSYRARVSYFSASFQTTGVLPIHPCSDSAANGPANGS
jgi:hypothetical protein